MTSNPDPSFQSTGIANTTYPSKTDVAVLEYPLYATRVGDDEVELTLATDDLFQAIDPEYWLLPDKNRYRWDVPPEIKDFEGNNAHPIMSMEDDPPRLDLSSFHPTYAGKVVEPAVKEGCSDPQTVVLSDNTKIDVSNAKMRFNVEKATHETLTGVVRFICPPASTGSNSIMWQDRAVMSIDTTGQSNRVTIRCVGNNQTAAPGMPPTVLRIEREQNLMTLIDTVTDRLFACVSYHTHWD
jgi:hypothetical protein